MNPETPILRRVMLALSKPGTRVLRNNVGIATYPDGSKVVYGLCKGSSDLIGWQTVTVTPEMIGKLIAPILVIEVKRKGGALTTEQKNFLNAVKDAGGIALKVESEADALMQLEFIVKEMQT